MKYCQTIFNAILSFYVCALSIFCANLQSQNFNQSEQILMLAKNQTYIRADQTHLLNLLTVHIKDAQKEEKE